ncbi:MAG TPA: hypothetical protein PKH07_16450 [bacterium]|nr:hypothetical protein [bacterium]
MPFSDPKSVLEVLSRLSELELALSDLYLECARIWPERAELWDCLGREEIEHAKYLAKIEEIVREQPQSFVVHRPFALSAIETFHAAIKRRLEQVRIRGLSLRDILAIARDFESSIIEMRFVDYLQFKDAQNNALAKAIEAQTQQHRKKLTDAVQAMQSSRG